MRIIVSVHEAYLLLSTLIQPPLRALPVKHGIATTQVYVRKNSSLLLPGTKQNRKTCLVVKI